MRTLRSLGLLAACFAACFSVGAVELPKLPPATMGMIDRARGLPPEFSADTLLTIAASPLITEKAWKLQLIDDAFRTAAHAQVPYPYTCHGPVDITVCQETGEHGMTALTLQTRAVEAMLEVDAQKGLALFEDLPAPRVAGASCQDIITPEVSAYYVTAGKVFERGFTAKQREKEEDLHLMETVVASMQSPVHVVPMMQVLAGLRLTPEQAKGLLARFAVVLDGLSGPDRLFAASEWAIVPAVAPEVTTGRFLPRPLLPEAQNVAMFVPALRAYLVRQLSGPRCGERMNKQLPRSVEKFNALVAKVDPGALLYKPITAEEATPSKDAGTFEYELPWKSQRAKDLLDAERWLNHGNRELPDDQRFWTLEERRKDEWMGRYHDTMKLIAGWKEEEEASADTHFWLVSQSYAQMATLVPPGAERENAMGVFLNFLETRYAGMKSRNLWFVFVRNLLGNARRTKDAAERAWILGHLGRSSNPVIALYAELATMGS